MQADFRSPLPRTRLWRAAALACLLAPILLAGGAAAQTASAPAPPPTITWLARGTHDQGLAIPSAQSTLLVFLRPGQSQSEEMIKLLGPLLKERKDVQVVGIVSGDDAAVGAAQLEKGRWTAPILADTDYDASGKFGVRVWPTVVIVSPTGRQVAHLPGLPVTFSNEVAAYLDFAAGKIDQAALDKLLADREVVADSTDQKAARHAEVALRLAEKGMKELAQAEVAKALELKPANPKLLLSLARTDLMTGDVKGAEALLARMPAGAQSPAELNVLKGWCAIQGGRWAEARTLLADATKLNPDPAEAYYLLGRVYEHDGDAAHAAECYRKAFEHSTEGKPLNP
jgi:thioredoxin-like negative regulator of GroEL